MHQHRVFQRFCSLLLAPLLLWLTMYGTSVQHASDTVKKDVAGQTSSKQTPTDQKAQLRTAPLEAVFTPIVTFDGGSQTQFLLPAPAIVLLLLWTVRLLREFGLPHYYFSYFRHVFGHHIATNAP